MFADAATTSVFTPASLPLVLADADTAAVNAPASLPLVLAEAVTVFEPAPPLVLTDAAATAVFAHDLLPLVLAQGMSLPGLLGCSRMSCQAQYIGCVHTSLFLLAALSLWPSGCVPLQHSLLARFSSLQTIRGIQHPLWPILHVEIFCALNDTLAWCPCLCALFHPTVTLV